MQLKNLGLGTAALGRPQYINIRNADAINENIEAFKQNSLAVLENAYKKGIRYFDTAPGYGLAEELLLDWVLTKNDASIKIATKWGYTYVANFKKNAKTHEVKEHSLAKLNEQWQVSKALLPYLKVYQIHSTTLETGVLENKAILEKLALLKTENNIQIGITTTGANQNEVIKKALDVSFENEQLFDAFQVTYNILEQSLIHVSEQLKKENKSIIIKEALANGRLFRNQKFHHYNELYTTLELLSKKYHVGIDAIALNFCNNTIPNSTILSGASNNKHLEDNIKSVSVNLEEKDIALLSNFGSNATQYWEERKLLDWN
ncbi:aldo/keto reductase [Tenacibaculum sp.]|nr:aldo/keto reductase [Tenacibaculum sp.]